MDGFKQKGHTILVLRPEINSGAFCAEVIDGISVETYRVIKIPKTEIYFLGAIKKRLREFQPQILLSHMTPSFLVAAQLKKLLKVPLFFGVHKSDVSHFRDIARYKKYLNLTNGVLFRSLAVKAQFEAVVPELILPSTIAFSGIEKQEIIQRSWTKSKQLRFIVCAKLGKVKFTDFTIKAMSKVSNDVDFQFNIVGDGPEKEPLKKLVEDLGLQSKVTFLGRKTREECLELMEEADIFIMVSNDTLGLAYLEAMAKGNIIIGKKGWGVDGIIEHEKSGFLVSGENIEELSDLIELLADRNLSLIQQESMKIIRKHTKKHAIENYLSFVLRVTNGKQ
jgi:glycosyltransferase involved in cell wall biosynthesis